MDISNSTARIEGSVPHDIPLSQQAGVKSQRPTSENGAGQPSQAAQDAAAEAREQAGGRTVSLSFSTYGKRNEKISVAVVDKETGEVIREVPPEELQRLSVKLEEMAGMVFDGIA